MSNSATSSFGSGGNGSSSSADAGSGGPGIYNDGAGNEPIAATSNVPTEPNTSRTSVLSVRKVNLNAVSNANDHHTDKFVIVNSSDNSQLVVRRGQPFKIAVKFQKWYDPTCCDLQLMFRVGNKPLASDKTNVVFSISNGAQKGQWGAKIVSIKGETIVVEVYTPPDCIVGKWTFIIDISESAYTSRYLHTDPIYILFNPWCVDDDVYMPEVTHLDEYILNETGRIYMGTAGSIYICPWNFGQFESVILDACLCVLELACPEVTDRGDPIPVSRGVSALVNSNDDSGVVAGNWGQNFSGGTSPTSWTGSVPILEEYFMTKESVKFGQCWVYAGVANTVFRALGIPSRCVSNYESAHNTDATFTVDFYYNASGDFYNSKNTDSVWNFHVWNEAWMRRRDLPNGYGGWQLVDSTPQEQSLDGGNYRCGPTSVIAIKHGEVNLPYDGAYVFSEVNADKIYWKADVSDQKFNFLYVETNEIGKAISTKAINSNERVDITDTYKFPEDSTDERSAVIKAHQLTAQSPEIYQSKTTDVTFTVEQNQHNTWLGDSFILDLNAKNDSEENRSVNGRIVVSSMYYTGINAETLKSKPFDIISLEPGKEMLVPFELYQDEYDGKLKDGYMVDVSILAHVKETNQTFVHKKDYRFQKPQLNANAPTEVVAQDEFYIDLSFTNPLKKELQNCSVTIDGLCPVAKYVQSNIPALAKFSTKIAVVPDKVGNQELIIVFNSQQLEDIKTSSQINIQKKEKP